MIKILAKIFSILTFAAGIISIMLLTGWVGNDLVMRIMGL